MKTMTCKQLGGACELTFSAETFEEIAKLSQKHGGEMAQAADEAHLRVMGEMKQLMQNPEAMQKWMADKEAEFESLPEDN